MHPRRLSPFASVLLILSVGLLAAACKRTESPKMSTDPKDWQAPQQATEPLQTLDIVSVGLLTEKLRQTGVWDAVKAAQGKNVISDAPENNEANAERRLQISDQRDAAGLELCLKPFVEAWPIPSVEIDRIYNTPDVLMKAQKDDEIEHMRPKAGLHWHSNVKVGHIFNDNPDDAMELAFQFFDHNPDAPALLLYIRTGYTQSGPRKYNDSTETVACIIVARRERVEWLRRFAPYVKGEPDPGTSPWFEGWASNPPFPFVPSKFVPRPWEIRQLQKLDALPTLGLLHRPVTVTLMLDKDGKPTFDPALKAAKPTQEQAAAAFMQGWQQLQQRLSAANAGTPPAAPAHWLYDFGDAGKGRAILPISMAMMRPEAASIALPQLEVTDPAQAINTFNVLGDTRSASPMVQWALAAFATAQATAKAGKDVDAAKDAKDTKAAAASMSGKAAAPVITLNLRNPDQITITAITPDLSAANRQKLANPGAALNLPLRPFN